MLLEDRAALSTLDQAGKRVWEIGPKQLVHLQCVVSSRLRQYGDITHCSCSVEESVELVRGKKSIAKLE